MYVTVIIHNGVTFYNKHFIMHLCAYAPRLWVDKTYIHECLYVGCHIHKCMYVGCHNIFVTQFL